MMMMMMMMIMMIVYVNTHITSMYTGVTPLMYASAGGYPEVVKYLIDKGAQVNLRHKSGENKVDQLPL